MGRFSNPGEEEFPGQFNNVWEQEIESEQNWQATGTDNAVPSSVRHYQQPTQSHAVRSMRPQSPAPNYGNYQGYGETADPFIQRIPQNEIANTNIRQTRSSTPLIITSALSVVLTVIMLVVVPISLGKIGKLDKDNKRLSNDLHSARLQTKAKDAEIADQSAELKTREQCVDAYKVLITDIDQVLSGDGKVNETVITNDAKAISEIDNCDIQ